MYIATLFCICMSYTHIMYIRYIQYIVYVLCINHLLHNLLLVPRETPETPPTRYVTTTSFKRNSPRCRRRREARSSFSPADAGCTSSRIAGAAERGHSAVHQFSWLVVEPYPSEKDERTRQLG